MKATKITAEQLRNDDGREYNPKVWEERIQSYSKYNDVQFYKVEKGNGYDYSRYFVVYTLPSGLRILNSFSYSLSLTSGGFQEAIITDASYEMIDGKLIITQFAEGEVEIKGRKFSDNDGKECWINTSENARKWMIERTKKFGSIFTKEGF
jgi:hypothetical protein